jgi:protein-disulfide isomerase
MWGQLAPWFQNDARTRDRVQLIFRHIVQSWHAQAPIVHEAALAVSALDKSKFLPFSQVLFEHQERWFDINAFDKTRNQMNRELAQLAETSVALDQNSVYDLLKYAAPDDTSKNYGNGVTNDLKWHIKTYRHNHIHVSPTLLVNGLIDDRVSSSWSPDQFKDLILSHL